MGMNIKMTNKRGREKMSLSHATIYSLPEVRTFLVRASLVASVNADVNASNTHKESIL